LHHLTNANVLRLLFSFDGLPLKLKISKPRIPARPLKRIISKINARACMWDNVI